jgi:hypothetical protein
MRKKLDKKHKDVEKNIQKEEQKETNETITTVRIKESKQNTRKK